MQKGRAFECSLLILLIPLILLTSGCNGLLESPGDQTTPGRPPGEFILPNAPQQRPAADDVRIGTLFYPDEKGRFLVPIQRAIPWTEGIAQETLSLLIPGPELNNELSPLGLTAALPAGTEINGLSINDGLARVDFNRSFLEYSPEEERLVLGSILCTLRQFVTIEKVELTFNNEYLDKFPGGAPGRLPLGPECWINVELDSDVVDYRDFTAVKLFFCYPSPNGWILYVPVTRILSPQEDAEVAAIKQLLIGPRKGSGLFSDIPPETSLQSFTVDSDGLATLDLSIEATSYNGGRIGAENMINQILLSISNLSEVEEVQILIEGEKVILKEGLDLTKPLPIPTVCNYF